MDIKSYIQSGIIESYVLGLANEEEVAEVEALSQEYPEVSKAIDEFSSQIESEAIANAIPPPPEVKSKLLQAIGLNEEENKIVVIPPQQTTENISNGQHFGKVVPISNSWKTAAAASIILLLGSAILNYYLYDKYSKQNKEYQALLTERNSLFASNQTFQAKYQQLASVSEMMADPKMAMIKMDGIPGKTDGKATIFWDTKSKDVYLVPNTLPQPSTGKQYQLWALVDGKPVDAGVLDLACEGACKMKNIPKAQGFAITLENEGGSANPTLTEMYVKSS